MNVVFVDASTLGRGDLSFERLDRVWKCTYFDTTSPRELPPRLAGQQVVVTNKVMLDAEVLAREETRDLRLIAVAATGTNNVDLAAAQARDVAVCNVSDYGTESVAQFTVSLILELASRSGAYAADVSAGVWERSPIFCLLSKPTLILMGKTLGIIGHGAIGRAVDGYLREKKNTRAATKRTPNTTTTP